MQNELDATHPGEIQLLGVNDIGFDSGNPSITDGRDLPWVQATTQYDVWDDWSVVFRDVIIVDANNVAIGSYNLTTFDLADPGNYNTLKQMLLDAI
jgi:hypothetical protein